jgi:hypothetical protein
MRFESRRGLKKKKKTCFVSWKVLFLFLLFFHCSFSFALQRWFLEVEVATPITFEITQNETHMMKI